MRAFFLLSLLLIFFQACYEPENPTVSGVVRIGNGKFISKQAKKIFVAFFKQGSFDSKTHFLKKGATPVFRTDITDLNSPPFKFQFDSHTSSGLTGFFFAFVDQDGSGGELPTSGDFYGFYPKNPAQSELISIGAFSISDIVISLDEMFAKPPIPIEISLGINVKVSEKATKIIFGFWKFSETKDGIPNAAVEPIIKKVFTDLSSKKWTFEASTQNLTGEAIPFAFLDQNDDGKFSEGDAYAVWKRAPFELEKVYIDTVQLLITEIYKP